MLTICFSLIRRLPCHPCAPSDAPPSSSQFIVMVKAFWYSTKLIRDHKNSQATSWPSSGRISLLLAVTPRCAFQDGSSMPKANLPLQTSANQPWRGHNVRNDNRDNVTEHHKGHGRKDDEGAGGCHTYPNSPQKGSFF